MSEVIAVWVSCGAASAVAAWETVRRYGAASQVRLLNTPVREEDPDNQRFMADVAAWVGRPVEAVASRRYPEGSAREVWERESYMAGPDGAPCTVRLKKHARQQFEAANRVDWHVLGFTADEKARHDRFVLTERSNVLPVLIDAGISKADCFGILRRAGLRLPAVYGRGYPNANCIGCVKASSPTYWNHVRRDAPDVFQDRAEQSRRLGARLVRVRGERIFLDELDPATRGGPMKSFPSPDCGVFCEERT